MRFLTSRHWINASSENADRSLHLIRVVVALILLMHPLYALAHPALNGRGHLQRAHL